MNYALLQWPVVVLVVAWAVRRVWQRYAGVQVSGALPGGLNAKPGCQSCGSAKACKD